MSFFIDTGNAVGTIEPSVDSTYEHLGFNESIKDILSEYKSTLISSSVNTKSKKTNVFDKFYDEMGWSNKLEKKQKVLKKNMDDDITTTRRKVDDLLKRSVLTSDFESLKQVPPFEVSEKQLKLQRRRDRAKTKGAKWYGLPATEMTKEVKHDLQVLQMRSVLDPKRFYKKNDLKVLPKYFQIGKVIDSPLDYYNNRLTKNQRKKTLVDELLADAEFNKYNKRKYTEIIEQKQSKAWKQAKKQKRKNKKK